MKTRPTYYERRMAIEDCREACRYNVLRTDDEQRKVNAAAKRACRILGIEHPEDCPR